MALLAASNAELGIIRAKGPSGLCKTFWILSSLEGLIRLYISKMPFSCTTKHSPEVHVHDNIIDFKKIFSKMIDYFRNFQKLNPSKISHYIPAVAWTASWIVHHFSFYWLHQYYKQSYRGGGWWGAIKWRVNPPCKMKDPNGISWCYFQLHTKQLNRFSAISLTK